METHLLWLTGLCVVFLLIGAWIGSVTANDGKPKANGFIPPRRMPPARPLARE